MGDKKRCMFITVVVICILSITGIMMGVGAFTILSKPEKRPSAAEIVSKSPRADSSKMSERLSKSVPTGSASTRGSPPKPAPRKRKVYETEETLARRTYKEPTKSAHYSYRAWKGT